MMFGFLEIYLLIVILLGWLFAKICLGDYAGWQREEELKEACEEWQKYMESVSHNPPFTPYGYMKLKFDEEK